VLDRRLVQAAPADDGEPGLDQALEALRPPPNRPVLSGDSLGHDAPGRGFRSSSTGWSDSTRWTIADGRMERKKKAQPRCQRGEKRDSLDAGS